ncbi:hypothetical protein DFJ58DRAFT_162205 [Suillus subalutaceus]|uniref:uncharacterized protein n=1 Tax=Suillus subalutaceus TaxID=48586 RepID=UPI001B87567B|nr:uncharacterized protein DFJ58DRAFT_162205 [Suillus subalutaceus]KAG1836739.1 hypothetical protein DFJ58DRAFT_162205 [Suillus subalutaceus]
MTSCSMLDGLSILPCVSLAPFHGMVGYTAASTLPLPSCDLDKRWMWYSRKLALPQPPLRIRTMSLLRHTSITTKLRRTHQGT